MKPKKSIKPLYYLCCLLLMVSSLAYGQKNKNQLEREKEDNLKKISETSKILSETQNKKEATVGQLTALSHEIDARNELINSIAKEVELLDTEIAKNEATKRGMQSDISTLKKEYAEMVYNANKSNDYYDNLTFLFSSKTFNQLYNRLQYFKQYSEARKNQLQLIDKASVQLQQQQLVLNKKRAEKKELLDSKTKESNSLVTLKKEQDNLISTLSKQEKELKSELEDTKKSVKKLEKLITDLIEAEREKAMKVAKKENKKSNNNTARSSDVNKVDATPEVLKMSNLFEENANKLLWPVQHGSISHHFGKQPHPVLRGVYIENLGVDIQTLKNEQVRNVFKGKVITVASVPGMNNVVMVQHGEYFTVYAKLKTVVVITGQEVNPKDILGVVYTDKDEVTELQFQIWKNNEKQDPERWLYKK